MSTLYADPQPGDVFREYIWWKTNGDAGGALRVGGREGTTNWGTKIANGYWETGWINLKHDIDLEYAVRAEVNIEKILCHDGTTGLSISLNESDWIDIPEAENIAKPQSIYQHHIYPNVEIPLAVLKEGATNKFKMRVSAKHSWNWPQNLVYGMHIRVYYDADKKPHPDGHFTGIASGDVLGTTVTLAVDVSSPNGDIDAVDFIGLYKDINWEGDGIYRQWHYHFFHGRITHHIGSEKKAPFQTSWNTDWLPDQLEPMQLSARVKDETGMIIFLQPVTDLTLERNDFSVELCKPWQVPKKWVTRSGEKSEKVNIAGDLGQAVGYQLCWASWSPGYMNGLYVNGAKVFDKEGPNYQYYSHRIEFKDVTPLRAGVNTIKTGKTPLHNGKMVHGMEVEWPGIMMLVKYDKTIDTSVKEREPVSLVLLENYPNPFNESMMIRYQLSKNKNIEVSIINLIGQKVVTLFDDYQQAGEHQLVWNGRNEAGLPSSSGVFFLFLQTDAETSTHKLTLLR